MHKLIKRESYLDKINSLANTDLIKVLLGIRRCGKTSLLYLWMEELKNKGVKNENIIFISFEDPKYNLIENFQQLDKIVYDKTKNIKGRIYLFFDEIQQVDKWEKSINGYRVSLDCDIYISGSNSKLLSNELSTYLAGRYAKIDVYPFSFKEVVKYKKEIEGMEFSEERLHSFFNDYYLKFGGMPTTLALNDEESIKSTLRDIYDSILINDIVHRYNISKIDLLKRYIRFLVNSIGQTYSSKSIKNYLKSNNFNTTPNTLLKYNSYIQQTFFISKCSRYDFKGKKLMKIYEKYYLTDHSFHHALIGENERWITRIIENIVYVELLRRGYNVNVGRLEENNTFREIDFVCEKYGKYVYIQVSYLLSNETTIEREFTPFFKIPDKYDTYVITADRFDFSHKGVKHLNIVDFLLGDEI